MLIVGVVGYGSGAKQAVARRIEQTCIALHIKTGIEDIFQRANSYLATGKHRFECWVDVVWDRPFRLDDIVAPNLPGENPFQMLPDMLVGQILGFATRTHGDRTQLSLVCQNWRKLVGSIGVVDQLWYGLRSSERLTSFLNPLKLGKIETGELQEGPCEAMAASAFEFLCTTYEKRQALKSIRSMFGVVFAANGVVLITFSGTLSTKRAEGVAKRAALEAINERVFKGKAQIVYAGAAGTIVDQTTLLGESVLDYTGSCLPRDFTAVGTTTKGENVDTLPGTCALPKLIMRCQALGLVPRWASEKLFDLSDKPISIEGSGGELVPFWPGHSVPSCGNCRVLVPLMLQGLAKYAEQETFRLEAQRRHHAAWKAYQQLLEEEFRTKQEAKLQIVRSGFETVLLELGDPSELIDVAAAFEVDGIAERVEYLRSHGKFSTTAAIGVNIAETYLDNYDRYLFEMFFAQWLRDLYKPPKKNQPTESGLRGQFSEERPVLGDLLELFEHEDFRDKIDWEIAGEAVVQAMVDTVKAKRERRKIK